MEVGGIAPRLTYALVMYGMVGRSRLPYTTHYRDSLLQTDYFSGFGLGARADFAAWRVDKFETTIGAGAGYEGITVVKDETPDDGVRDSKTLPTLNLNVGAGVNYYAWSDVFFGLFARYNVVNFRNDLGTSFIGDTWTIGVTVGGGSGVRKIRTGIE